VKYISPLLASSRAGVAPWASITACMFCSSMLLVLSAPSGQISVEFTCRPQSRPYEGTPSCTFNRSDGDGMAELVYAITWFSHDMGEIGPGELTLQS